MTREQAHNLKPGQLVYTYDGLSYDSKVYGIVTVNRERRDDVRQIEISWLNLPAVSHCKYSVDSLTLCLVQIMDDK